MIKRHLYIFICLLIALPLSAKKKSADQPVDSLFLYYFYEGQQGVMRSDYTKALAMFSFANRLNDKDAATHENLGYLYQGMQQADKALEHYKQAYELDPMSYWSTYASTLFSKGDNKEATKVLEKTCKLLPKEIDAFEALSAIYSAQSEYKKALKVQDKIEQIEGINAYNTYSRYQLLLHLNQPKKALQALDKYLALNPDDLNYQAAKAELLLTTEKDTTLFNNFKQEELTRHPDNPYFNMVLARQAKAKNLIRTAADYTLNALHSEHYSLNEKLRAMTQMNDILSLTSTIDDAVNTIINDYPFERSAYITCSRLYELYQEPQKAQKILEAFIEVDPNDKEAYDSLFKIYQNDTTLLITDIEQFVTKAYQHFPQNPQWIYYQTRLLLSQQQIDSAIVVAKQMPDTQEEIQYRLATYILLGDLFTSQKEYESAFEQYEKALMIDPQNTYVLNNYAYTLSISEGDLRKAEKMSQITIEKEPDNAMYLDTYAWILHLQNQDSLAKYYIQKAKDNLKGEGDMEILIHYNIIYQQ